MGHNTDNKEEQTPPTPFSNILGMLDNLTKRDESIVATNIARNIRQDGKQYAYIEQVDGTTVLHNLADKNLTRTKGSRTETHIKLDPNAKGDVFSNLAGENLVEEGESFTKIVKKGGDPELKYVKVPDSDKHVIVDPIEEENEPLDKSGTVHEIDGGNKDSKKSGCFSRTRKSFGKFFRRLFPGFQNITVFSCCNASVV
ncbi:unnamed protein product [Allacma fusca]|uniref:Uncharacterized protein n=1 Tax=Allacma fusca TaxID=39272 RepID=A0A8J2K1Q0_9HEXA|nr:unnamed protein product [Allacma fusca]